MTKRKETRLTIITKEGRALELWNVEIEEHIQDEGRTLKLFVKDEINKLKESMIDKLENKPDYKKAYNILMDYWDSLPDEEKEDIDKRLKECGC